MLATKSRGVLIGSILLYFITFSIGCEDVGIKPTFEMASKKNKDVELLKSNRLQYFISSRRKVQLACTAVYPIQIKFWGNRPNVIDSTEHRVKNSNCYRVIITFISKSAATGLYSCEPIDDAVPLPNTEHEATTNTIYIFAQHKNNEAAILWENDKRKDVNITEVINNKTALIPCVTSSPTAKPLLYKVNTNVIPNAYLPISNLSYHFEPSEGFIINFTKVGWEGVNGRYYCKLRNKDPNIYSFNVHIPCVPHDITRITEHGHAFCRNGGQPHHAWSISQNKGRSEMNSSIGFHKNTSHFYCCAPPGNTTIITLINCQNSANCEAAERFASKFRNLPYPFEKGASATDALKLRIGVPKDSTCAVISKTVFKQTKFGIAHCSISKIRLNPQDPTESTTYNLKYFRDLDNRIVMDVEYTNKMHVLRMLPANITVHQYETVLFSCNASAYIFAKDLEFLLIFNNQTKTKYKTSNVTRRPIEDGTITRMENISIWNLNITGIECRAPKWRTRGWGKISTTIHVKKSSAPEIVSTYPRDTEVELEAHKELPPNGIKRNISCTATGVPLPTIQWTHNNSVSVSKRQIIIGNDTRITSILQYTDDGVYTCTANNSIGKAVAVIKVTGTHLIQNSTNHWIYILVSIFVVGIPSIVAILFLYKRLKSKQEEIERLTESEIRHFHEGNEDLVKKYEELHDVAQYLPYKQEYEIHPSKIDIKNDILGSGYYGMVLKGEMEKSGRRFPVAIKTVKEGIDIVHLKALLSEIKIMMYIGKHPCIIEMFGAITKDLRLGKLYVAVEFCSNGDLQTYLRKYRDNFLNQIVNDEIITSHGIKRSHTKRASRRRLLEDAITTAVDKRRSRFSHFVGPGPSLKTTDLISWCYQVAYGMDYLGTKKVVHGDLAARNLLVTDNLIVKITDFGLSRHLYDYTNYVTKQKNEPLPWRWLAIEAIQDSKFSAASDMWAYGITLWEIFSLGEMPYQGLVWGEEFVHELVKGYRMSKPQYSTTDIHKTMLECWNANPKNRPTFFDISQKFKQFL